MKTILALLVLTGTALGQAGYPPYEGYPETEFAPIHKWSDVQWDVNRMANTFSATAFRPRSYEQWQEDNKPKAFVPPVTTRPIVVRDRMGRVAGTVQSRSNGVTTVRDSRGRITQTATMRAGTLVVKDAKSTTKKGK